MWVWVNITGLATAVVLGSFALWLGRPLTRPVPARRRLRWAGRLCPVLTVLAGGELMVAAAGHHGWALMNWLVMLFFSLLLWQLVVQTRHVYRMSADQIARELALKPPRRVR